LFEQRFLLCCPPFSIWEGYNIFNSSVYVKGFSSWKEYQNLTVAFWSSLLRIVFLPALAMATIALFQFHSMNQSLLMLIYAMSVAVSLSVLSERYDFKRETIAS
jgi:hypothetical protein